MIKEEYLKRLLELKQYLKDHPSARVVYSDIPVNRLITELKYQILEEKEIEEHEQNRQNNYDWVITDRVPFL